jgi:hypothetical protein
MPVGQNFVCFLRATSAQLEGWYRPAPFAAWIEMFRVHDDEPLLHGSVGMEVADGGSASFDNVLVAQVIATAIAHGGVDGSCSSGSLAVRVAPNPLRNRTEIAFTLPQGSRVRLAVYNVGGELVRLLTDSRLDAGPHSLVWDGTSEAGVRVGSGVYLLRLEAGREVQTRKAVLRR